MTFSPQFKATIRNQISFENETIHLLTVNLSKAQEICNRLCVLRGDNWRTITVHEVVNGPSKLTTQT